MNEVSSRIHRSLEGATDRRVAQAEAGFRSQRLTGIVMFIVGAAMFFGYDTAWATYQSDWGALVAFLGIFPYGNGVDGLEAVRSIRGRK